MPSMIRGLARCLHPGGGLARCLRLGGDLARSPASPWAASASSTAAGGPVPSAAASKASTTVPFAAATFAGSEAVGAFPAASPTATMLGVKAAAPASSILHTLASALPRRATTSTILPRLASRQLAAAVPGFLMVDAEVLSLPSASVPGFLMIDAEVLGLPSASTHRTQAVLVMILEGHPKEASDLSYASRTRSVPTATAMPSMDFHSQGASSERPLTGATCLMRTGSTWSRSPFALQRRHYSSSSSHAVAYTRDEHSSTSHYPILSAVDFIEKTPSVWVVPYEKNLIGEIQIPPPQLMLREEGKVMSQSLLQELHGLHLQGYCLYKPLSLDDLIATDLGRLEIRDGTLMVPTNDLRRHNNDWYWSSSVLKQIVQISVQAWKMRNPSLSGICLKAPRDVGHLYHLLENPALPKGYNACFHSSLIPLHERSRAFMETHDLVINALTSSTRSQILKDLPDVGEWNNVLHQNTVLKFWFDNYRNTDGSFSFPDLKGKGFDFMLQQRVFRCHMYDHRNRMKYDKDDVEFLLHNKNPLLLPWVHHRLLMHGRLGLLKPDRFFPFATERVIDI